MPALAAAGADSPPAMQPGIADGAPSPSLPAAPAGAPTVVPAGQTLLLGVAAPALDPVRVEVGARLGLSGDAYTIGDLLYDPGVLQPAGQAADGGPLLVADGPGASYLSALASPRCPQAGTPCPGAPVPLRYVVFAGVPPGKEAFMRREAQQAATALAQPTEPPATLLADIAAGATAWALTPSPTPCGLCLPPGVATVGAGAGVIVPFQGGQPFPSSYALIENDWQELGPDGSLITVWGGVQPVELAPGEDRSQGIVIVQTTTAHNALVAQNTYLTPSKHGSVHVVSAVGQTLTLLAKDGTTFVFDVPARAFLAPDGQPLPTATADTGTPADTPAASPSPVATGVAPAAPGLGDPTIEAATRDGAPISSLLAAPTAIDTPLASPDPALTSTATSTAVPTDGVPTPLATAAP